MLPTSNSVEHSPSWEANTSSANQEIYRILWKPKVHYRIHNSQAPVLILNQIDPVNIPTSYFSKIRFNITLPSMAGSFQCSPSFRLPTKTLYVSLISPIRAICPAHFSLGDLINRMIFGEEYRAQDSSLFHSPVTSCLLGPKSSSAPHSRKPSAYVHPSVWATKFHTHVKEPAKLYFCIFHSLHFWIADSNSSSLYHIIFHSIKFMVFISWGVKPLCSPSLPVVIFVERLHVTAAYTDNSS